MLKSLFISSYISLLHFVAILSGYQLVNAGFSWALLGLLVASLPAMLLFDFLLITKSLARTDRSLSPITLITFIGLGFVAFDGWISAFTNTLSLVFVVTVSIGWLTYIYWYSSFGKRHSVVLKAGNKLPNLTLVDLDQRDLQTNSLLGAPCLFLFYRGNWCPLCMAQIQEVANAYKQFSEMGVQVVLVSPQSHQKTQKLAQRFNIPLIFLQDPSNRAAKYLGICAENGLPFGLQLFGYESDVPMPTVVATDKNGNILFAHLTDNYRLRPEPETFLRLFEHLRT